MKWYSEKYQSNCETKKQISNVIIYLNDLSDYIDCAQSFMQDNNRLVIIFEKVLSDCGKYFNVMQLCLNKDKSK